MNTKKFSIETEKAGTEVRVYLQGDLDLSAAGEFRAQMEPLANDDSIKLTLDLAKLTYIDRTGSGILISILKVRNTAGASLHVEHVPAHIQKLLDMTGISKFFEIKK